MLFFYFLLYSLCFSVFLCRVFSLIFVFGEQGLAVRVLSVECWGAD